METMSTLQITLPRADAAFLRRQSRGMGWEVKTVRSPRAPMPKVEMTEEEFRAKLALSSAEGAAGKTIRMHDKESAEQFVNRLLCM